MIQDRFARINGVKVDFEAVKKGDTFELFESNGEQVITADGDSIFVAIGDAFKDDDGIWTIPTR